MIPVVLKARLRIMIMIVIITMIMIILIVKMTIRANYNDTVNEIDAINETIIHQMILIRN